MNKRLDLLFNLLPYRSAHTGLSRYVQRILAAWPDQLLPPQLRISREGKCHLSTNRDLPDLQRSVWMRFLQRQGLVQYALPVRRILHSQLPDRIYSPYTDWLSALPNLPQVITCHDLTPLHYPNSHRAYWRSRVLLPHHMHQARLVIAISRTVADQLVATGLAANRIAVVYNGVEPVDQPINAPASENCVILARHARNKNIALSLVGFAKFLALAPQWTGQLFVVGARDRCTPSLLRQQRELGLEGRVSWIENLSNQALLHLLSSAFCLISPSLMEGFDYPLLEAQALGLPTLASRIPVHEELHHEASLFFELQDHGDTLSHQLLRLSRESALWRQLSQAGLRNASLLTSQRQALALHQLLREPLT